MSFNFPLEAILRLKRGQERVERTKLEALSSVLAQAKSRLDFIDRDFLETRRNFRQRMSEETYGSELQFEELKSGHVEANRRALESRISELEQARLKQVDAFAKSRRSRETIENLRDEEFHTYRQMMSRREQQQLDDLFLMRLGLDRDAGE